MKRTLLTAVAVLATTAALVTVVPGVAGASPYCGIRWGSQPKSRTGALSPLTNVRAGRHACFDRLVLDLRGPASGVRVRYVAALHSQGEGSRVSLRGGAFLDLLLLAPAYDGETGIATYRPRNRAELVDVRGWRTFRQVAWGGTYEGYTTIGLGVRARLPYRVFALAGPGDGSRLVIDVAHRW